MTSLLPLHLLLERLQLDLLALSVFLLLLALQLALLAELLCDLRFLGLLQRCHLLLELGLVDRALHRQLHAILDLLIQLRLELFLLLEAQLLFLFGSVLKFFLLGLELAHLSISSLLFLLLLSLEFLLILFAFSFLNGLEFTSARSLLDLLHLQVFFLPADLVLVKLNVRVRVVLLDQVLEGAIEAGFTEQALLGKLGSSLIFELFRTDALVCFPDRLRELVTNATQLGVLEQHDGLGAERDRVKMIQHLFAALRKQQCIDVR